MTDLSFHFNVPDKLRYTCRLLRKAVGNGVHLTVTGHSDFLAQLDNALWTFSTTDFLAHCDADASPSVRQKSPVLLTGTLQGLPRHDVLVNVGDQVPTGFEQFARLIEIVTKDDVDRQLARQRWKHYVQAGFSPIRHDLDLAAAS